ncbi:MAG: DUF1460 domain-containing protein [Bacteroidetes bacterium]|nr:DUF1460 domain-containing protein [Bacteroidota bacterium]
MSTLKKSMTIAALLLILSGGFSCYYGGSQLGGYASLAGSILSVPSEDAGTIPDSTIARTIAVDVTPRPLSIAETMPDLDSLEVRSFENLMQLADARRVYLMPIDSIVQWVGERFVGSTYVGGMLDAADEEQLVVSFRKFDCVLFVETVLALSEGVASRDYSGSGFVRRLETLRYRGGEMNGYASRLHYFSDWLHDNQIRGNVRDVTEELGGVGRSKTLNIMSKHRRLYRRLATDDSLHQEIVEMEARLATIPQYYIPQDLMRPALDLIKPGDIVSTATIARGLDVSHSGFAYRNADGSIGLLHASSANGEVMVTPSLRDYVVGNRLVEGIVVARPIRPTRIAAAN